MSSLTRNKRLWAVLAALAVLSTAYLLLREPVGPSPADTSSTTTTTSTATTIPARLCGNLTGTYLVDCFTEEALDRGDIDVCDNLDGSGRLKCVEEYAYAENDLSICNTFEDERDRIHCVDRGVVELGESGTVNPEDCGLIPADLRRDKCLFHAATINEDDGVCDSIADDDMRLYCITAVTGQNLCNIIKDGFHHTLCGECAETGDCSITAREYGGEVRWW